jgi:predicted RNase H-like HicB family nuclease
MALQLIAGVRQTLVDASGRPSYARRRSHRMRSFAIVVERDPDTGLLVGHVPGWPGAHSQGRDIEELKVHLQEVIAMLLEDGEPELESEFVGVQTVQVA